MKKTFNVYINNVQSNYIGFRIYTPCFEFFHLVFAKKTGFQSFKVLYCTILSGCEIQKKIRGWSWMNVIWLDFFLSSNKCRSPVPANECLLPNFCFFLCFLLFCFGILPFSQKCFVHVSWSCAQTLCNY